MCTLVYGQPFASNPALDEVLRQAFASQTIRTQNLDELCALAEEKKPALVVIDHAPKGQLLEDFTQKVRGALLDSGKTRIIMLSDSLERGYVQFARACGIDSVVSASLGADGLTHAIRRVLPDQNGEPVAERTEAMVATRDDIGALARLVVHDLRGPLTVMCSALAYLENEGLEAEGEELVWECQDAVRRMISMVNNISGQARVSQGSPIVLNDEVDLAVLVAEVTADMRDAFRLQALAVELTLDAGLLVKGNSDGLRRVVENLVTNAAEHSPLEGKVGIRLGRGPGNTVVLRISDQGVGISDTHHREVFELFAQSRLKAQGVRLGKGLSLVLAAEIIRQHGGTIAIQNDAQGGEFAVAVTLPLGEDAD